MKRKKTLQAVTIWSLTLLQLSTAFGPGYVLATEQPSETYASQVLETKENLPEQSSDDSVQSSIKEEVDSTTPVEPTKDPVKDESSEEVVEDNQDQTNPKEESTEEIKPEQSSEKDDSSSENDSLLTEEQKEQDEEKQEEPEKTEEAESNPEESITTFSAKEKKIAPAAYKKVDYMGAIFKTGNTIDSLPWGTKGYKTIGYTNNFIGKVVRITQISENGAYGYVSIEGFGNGWIDLKAIRELKVTSVNQTNYITEGKYEIDTLPWGTSGFQKLGTSSQYLGKNLQIRYKTENGAYYYIEQDGKAIGWIDSKAFGLKGNEYTAIVSAGNYEVNTLPWGTPGYKKTATTKDYMGLEITVKGSLQNGSYLLVAVDGVEIGWVDKRAMVPFETKAMNYNGYIASGTYEIDTLPWGTPGFRKIGTTEILLGNYVEVTRESMNGAYAYIRINGKGQGWIDKRALKLKGDPYTAIIQKGNFNIDTLPWGTPGFQKIASTSEFMGQELEVVGTTQAGNYALVYKKGTFLGWIDVKALKKFTYSNVNYTAQVSGGKYEVDTLPWGEPGFKKIGSTSSYEGLTVTISKVSGNGAYWFASFNGKELGWIDKKAFGFEKLSYSFYITSGAYNLDTLPWGTIGYKTIGLTNSLMGRELEVIARTQNGAYLQVAQNGQVLGWIDSKAGKRLNENTISYSATISTGGYNIDSLPWGTIGYKKLGNSADYVGKSVSITKESENKAYVFVVLNGAPLGWLDKRALKTEKTIFIDAGHGGTDGGATYFGVKEKDINLQVSLKVQNKLESLGYKVIMVRTDDRFIDHATDRSKIANASGADIFISIHHNAMPSSQTASGIETFYYKYEPDWPSKINQEMHNDPTRLKESAALAHAVQNSLIKSTGAINRKVQTESFAVLRETAIPAILVELGFMSNPTEAKKLITDSYQNTLAQAVVDGVSAYFNSK